MPDTSTCPRTNREGEKEERFKHLVRKNHDSRNDSRLFARNTTINVIPLYNMAKEESVSLNQESNLACLQHRHLHENQHPRTTSGGHGDSETR
ncbi:hypothetical protein E2C01_006550 [Portunus trituberculatus]|uniref:Uncharacterized protein n=1 Tax=Portunus trituberculatus TaxID=210409 RepID=A0A5B7D247_PORTR|nr:hypothetical protein [Portunus trituberculatus]